MTTLLKMKYFREFFRRFAQILTDLSQYFSASRKSLQGTSLNVVLIYNFVMFILDLKIFTRELFYIF